MTGSFCEELRVRSNVIHRRRLPVMPLECCKRHGMISPRSRRLNKGAQSRAARSS